VGILKTNGTLKLRPPAARKMKKDEVVFLLAEDNSALRYRKQKIAEPGKHILVKKTIKREPEKELILGWHSIAEIVLREYADFLPQGSKIDIMIYDPSAQTRERIKAIQAELRILEISLIQKNPLSRQNLKNISPFSYNNIIILAQDEKDYTPEKVDSDTMLILLLLREIIKEEHITDKKTKIITQVLNSDNQELIEQSNVDDFIISNKMITKIMAQISENPSMKEIYDQLFCAEGSEIYLKPASYYCDPLPVTLSFLDILWLAQQRNEICLGVRKGSLSRDPHHNFGLILNPAKSSQFTLEKDDTLVVLAEDEL
jgi:ion channel POLLUX/CASTOR